MPAKRCIETKNMCLLFVDYCKMMSVPKEKRETGYRKEKMTPVPKGKRETGYREEKMMPVPKGKRENGYREEKMKW